MTWVKVCGLRTPAEVAVAEAAAADAIGLVLVASSPRVVTMAEAKALTASTSVPTILLTENMSPGELIDAVGQVGAGGAQPYGIDALAAGVAVARAGGVTLLPIQVRETVDLASMPDDLIPLLDGFSKRALGGTGTPVPRDLVPRSDRRFVLAGGLTPDNVGDVIADLVPWGVDASSGLESSPGVKDHVLIRAFVQEARNAHET